MKKIIIIVMSLILLTGCGSTKEEKENMFYNSIEKAYISLYSTKGVGLPAIEQDKIEVDGKKYFKVSSTKYKNMETLENLIDESYTEKVATELKTRLHEEYKEIDSELYTLSDGGCLLDYQIDDTLLNNLKENIKIKKIKINKITFKYNDKTYTAKKSNNFYLLDQIIFECNE